MSGERTTILVGYDGSDTARLAVREAADLAAAFDGVLRVVWAVDELSDQTYFNAWPQDDLESSLNKRNEGIVARAHDHLVSMTDDLAIEGCDIHPVAILGHPATVLVDEAESAGASVLVVGNKGTQGVRRLLGSVATDVLAKAPCSVFVAKTT